MKLKVHEFTDPEDNFLITSPTYKHLYQSTLPPFFKIMEGLGSYNSKLEVFTVWSGAKVWCRTETDPDSIVGIPRIRHIWSDEAGKYRRYFWENILARADSCGCAIDLTTSPYSLNWIFKELIQPTLKGARTDIEIIQAASWENPNHALHDPEKRELRQRTMDRRRFNMLYGGIFDKMQGLVYDCFDEEANQVDPFPLPTGTRYFAGIDWGYTDPFVIKVRAVTPDFRHYGVSELYRTGMTISDMIEAAKLKQRVFNIERFYADPSQPGHIEEFNRHGLPCVGSGNDIRRGIDLTYGLLKTRRLKYFRGMNPHTIDEFETYHYPEPIDLKPDQDGKDQLPVGQNDHCFAGWTQITTSRGLVPIAKVVEGDEVLTSIGYRPVLKKWDNGIKEVGQLILPDGTELECTPEHLVFTYNRGFIRADALRYTDLFDSIGPCKKEQSRNGISWSISPLNIQGIHKVKTYLFEAITAAGRLQRPLLVICMSRFGKLPMVQYLRGCISIISTEIRLITTSQTWNLFSQLNISPSIAGRTGLTQHSEKKASLGSPRFVSWPPFGTKALRGDNGTVCTRKESVKQESRLIGNALSVEAATKQSTQKQLSLDSVLFIVRQKLGIFREWMTLIGNVSSVVGFSELIGMSRPSTVQSRAGEHLYVMPRKERGKREVRVYDLTIADVSEYYANGIRVHNCMDTERYLSLSLEYLGLKNAPKIMTDVKKMTRTERTEWLKKKRSSDGIQTEKWSE